ncbi:E6 [Zalophus californianus papillomavirus 1]|uniref:Protein E6 n=1 Tax=Zalophus californianus papillomavirus 1 TaxID=998829 RepID=F2X1C2_9PAPI|nr:E6 [Zalophus californianus papillomavirus 1]ADZ74260.1 E6 [Zalophus californianus papillomavirus 1]
MLGAPPNGTMAQPTTIQEWCRRLGIPEEDILLPCTFCGRFMSEQDRKDFDSKTLQLQWKHGNAHGCCGRCARAAARHERRHYYQGSLTGQELLTVYGAGVLTLPIRCPLCLRKLGTTEILSAIGGGRYFDLVRGRWKARCRFCLKADNDWERGDT